MIRININCAIILDRVVLLNKNRELVLLESSSSLYALWCLLLRFVKIISTSVWGNKVLLAYQAVVVLFLF